MHLLQKGVSNRIMAVIGKCYDSNRAVSNHSKVDNKSETTTVYYLYSGWQDDTNSITAKKELIAQDSENRS